MTDEMKTEVLALLPVRNMVLFPQMLLPLSVARPSSLAAVQAAMATEEKQIVVVAQRIDATESIKWEDFFTIGTKATIRKMSRPAEGLIEPVVALIEPAYHAKGVTLQATVSHPVLVWADAEKIHQVLVNLLTNALAATRAGGHVTVTVATRLASTEEIERASGTGRFDLDTVVTLAVCDSGCGMPQEDVERAFQPFFTTKAIGKGTGLGLFLSREAVVAHGGQLILESEIGVGTTVTVVLPGLQSGSATA